MQIHSQAKFQRITRGTLYNRLCSHSFPGHGHYGLRYRIVVVGKIVMNARNQSWRSRVLYRGIQLPMGGFTINMLSLRPLDIATNARIVFTTIGCRTYIVGFCWFVGVLFFSIPPGLVVADLFIVCTKQQIENGGDGDEQLDFILLFLEHFVRARQNHCRELSSLP